MIRYSPSTRGFYHVDLHPTIPADAVEVTAARHRKLLAEQAAGAEIAPHPQTGEPIARPRQAESHERKLERARRRIRAQADRRIGASPWPMLHALFRHVTEGAPLDAETTDAFARLDAIERAAANAEQALARRKDPDGFDAADPKHWPASEGETLR